MLPKHIIILIFLAVVITKANFWRRRRRSCSQSNCQMSSWSSWSTCSAQLCGIQGSQKRSRHVRITPSCGGKACPSNKQETRSCYGTAAVNCVYSSWSKWSSCSLLQCGDYQSSRRHIIAREQCGGSPCNMTTLRKTRPCNPTFCVNQGTLLNGKCVCKPGFNGSCCQYNRDGQPCPYEQNGSSLKKCSAGPQKFPTLYLGYPVISPKDETNEAVSLLCIVPIHEKIRQWKNVTYHIEWYVNGEEKKKEKPFCEPGQDEAENSNPCPGDKVILSRLLPGNNTHKYYKPGQWITCEVKARYTTDPLHPWSDTVTILHPFFAGIMVTPSTLFITECQVPFFQEITLTPTIPVRNTFLTVTFYLPKGLWLENKGDCSIQLQGTKSVTVRVGATCTTLYGLRKLSVITPQITTDSVFWGYFGLPTVRVTVLQKDQKLHKCMSVTDPHIRMLDEQNAQDRWHDFFGNGEYLLYHNKERHFEVQTKQWGCDRKEITCNCGVIIRDHNDLINFSCCGDPPRPIRDATTPIRIDIPRKKCLAPRITIRESMNGKNTVYEVITPTGIKVRLERNYWGIDVTIYAPKTENSGDVAGLCTYKGQDRDISALEPTYRKSPSYFEKLPEEINKGASPFQRSCPCNKEKDNNDECTEDGIKVEVFYSVQTKHFNRIKMCDSNPEKSREKRDVEGSDELTNEDYEFFMTPSESNAHDRVKRSLVSKENATRYCAERLTETPVGKLCAKLGTNVQALVNVCSADIEYTGDHSFAIGAVAMLINECNDVIIENITVNTNETSNVTKPTMPPIMEEVAQLLCPNDCTFNGKCVNGSCVCNKDYTANDCSISIYQTPSIARIQGNGLCDRRKRPCKKATIQGVDFLNSRNLTCHIKEIEIVNSSWIPNKYETKYQGIMTDLVLVECLLPDTPVLRMRYDETAEGIPAAGLMISVSNNGIDKSDQQLKMISFDSVCMDCNVSTGCFFKKNTCFINRYCFAPNEPNPRDWCQQCIPEVNTNTWTKRQVNLPPNVTSQTNYYVVYGENFKLPIEAIDPEGMPVTISLMKGSPKEAFIRKNVLYWNVTTNQTTHFSFNATDACRASATLNITVTVNVCPCNNRGRCIPQDPRGQGIYACLCSPGYTGQYCNTEIDECASYPCLRGRCIDLLNNYSCSCDLGFEGRNCDVDIDYCMSSPCVYGNCTDEVSGYSCNCLPGYSGLECEVDIDECSSAPCLNNGSCSDQVNGFKCHCLAGYAGHNCSVNINECQSSPCVNKGTCMDKINGFTCHCPPGFSGSRCEENVNECVQVSCGNGNCIDGVNNYSCVCNVGYTGRHCDVIITKCSNDSCYPGVSCMESTTPISCGLCPPGFTGNGKTCKDIDDCINHTCANNASCVDGINGYTCNCTAGYTGSHCKTDIDDCVNHTCANGASCVDGINDYSCSCVVGYTGGQCDKDIDECFSSPCDNGGSCIDGVNNFSCNCSTGFTGKRCETNIDDCFNVTCRNGGSCEDGISNFTCSCQAGYTGVLCETDIDDCVNHTCANYGSCVDGVSDFSCICMEGYTGVWCEKDVPTLSPTPPDRRSPKKIPSTTTGPTTQAGVDDNGKTDFTLQIRVLEAWDSSLQDKNSEKFKELANIMKKEIWRTYSGRSELKEVEIISMRPGSIIAEFRLTFKTKVTSEDALTPLKREVATGKLGRLQIDPDSLKEKEALQDFHKKDEVGNNLPLIVGLSCGAFVLVVTFAITMCYCKRSVPFAAHSRIGPEMPPDEPCSRREKYEMAPTISKEPEHQEEEGIFNEGMEK